MKACKILLPKYHVAYLGSMLAVPRVRQSAQHAVIAGKEVFGQQC